MKFNCIQATLLVGLFALTGATNTLRKLGRHANNGNKLSKSAKGTGLGKFEDDLEATDMYPMIDSMSLDLSMSFEATPGKDGKKGGHSTKVSKSSKATKSGKKSSKKGGATEHPAGSPSSSGDGHPPSTAPPPSSLPPPEGLQAVEIPRFGIFYSLSQNLMPMRDDYLEVEALTNDFFNAYMLDIFEEPGGNSLVEFRTALHTSEFIFDQPVLIYYDSVAYFAEELPSDSLPSAQTLETLLQLSLENPSEYLDLLGQLGVENAFSSTTAVEFANDSASISNSTTDDMIITDDAANEETQTSSSSEESGLAGPSLFAIAAGAVGAGFLFAGVLFFRRRNHKNDDNASFIKRGKSGRGGATIAGETFAGDSYDGTASMAPRDRQSSDQERGDSVEPTQSSDVSSVSPAWEEQERYDNGDDSVSDAGVAKMTRQNVYDQKARALDTDDSVSDDIMSVGTAGREEENASTERHKLSVAEIEAMLYSQF